MTAWTRGCRGADKQRQKLALKQNGLLTSEGRTNVRKDRMNTAPEKPGFEEEDVYKPFRNRARECGCRESFPEECVSPVN